MPALKLSDVTAAVAEIIRAGVPFQVARGDYVNVDPGVAVDGWVGVYRGGLQYAPHTIGGRAFNITGEIIVIVQAAGAGNGGDTEELLEGYIQDVITAIEADKTLGGTVTMLIGYTIEYSYALENSASLHMQWATLRLQFEKRVQL